MWIVEIDKNLKIIFDDRINMRWNKSHFFMSISKITDDISDVIKLTGMMKLTDMKWKINLFCNNDTKQI